MSEILEQLSKAFGGSSSGNYRSRKSLDDPFKTEGDTAFLRMNARLRPNQLQPGEVALSQNGRMNKDGTWQVRKGLSTLAGAITVGADSLRLPFPIASAQRTGGVVTLTLSDTPSLDFVPTENLTVVNLGYSSADPNGTFALSSVDFTNKTVTYPDTGADESFTIVDADANRPSVTSPGDSIRTTLNFNLADDEVNAVYGSAVFSDPSADNDDFIFTATNSLCLILRLRDSAEFKVRYEAGGESVDRPVDVVQSFDKMFIFRTTKTTLEATPVLTRKDITLAARSSNVITITAATHGRVANDYVTLTGLGGWTTDPNDVYKVVSATTNTFTVVQAGANESFNTSGAFAEYFSDFTRVSYGAYTAPTYKTDANAVAANGVVTMDLGVTSHGLSIGDPVTIRAGAAPYDALIGTEFRVQTVPTANIFTFNGAVVDTDPGTSCTVSKPLSLGQGFIHMPAAPWGVPYQRRMWIPYWYTSVSSPANRDIRDEIVASDIMDANTYDVIGNQFRITGGQSDYLVGVTPFTVDTMAVFMRKSIHIMTGVSGSLADVATNEVTREVGCSARKTITQVANQILFLSDEGVYAVEFLDQYNLRGSGVPLSEPVKPYIDRINQQYVDNATAIYFDNRFWIALPLDSAVGQGDAVENNTILVYNFLNQGWESIDTVNSTSFAVRDLLIGREGAQNALYLTTPEGGVHKVDGFDGGDVVSVTAGQALPETIAVVSALTSRQYDVDSFDRKRFSRSELQVKSETNSTSDASITYIIEDPDATTAAVTISDRLGAVLPAGEEASIRQRVRRRGFGCQIDFRPSLGRPFLRGMKVDARISDRKTISIS